ncbi:MAG: alpha/beta hydrolase [Pseudohongiella sp.]|nr:alpha/beta hydrolase [Pseudohongiella sp.]MDP2092237.1 alpha/beta hydrolase [Pseudohongiella sp.]MDP2283497.1 alpha/beta hydrolase [Pseudohongiella sp.]
MSHSGANTVTADSKRLRQDGVLIVPGFRGSDEAHWQSWLQMQIDGAQRLSGVDWDDPVLSVWAGKIRQQLQRSDNYQWIVAHSFGCLAAAIAVADRPQKVAGVIFVAPADPARFHLLGCRQVHGANAWHEPAIRQSVIKEKEGVWPVIPSQALGVEGVVIASENDPWLTLATAGVIAERWGLDLTNVGQAGHINTEGGYGPWPYIKELLASRMRQASAIARPEPGNPLLRLGRGSVLAHVRQQTRRQMEGRI